MPRRPRCHLPDGIYHVTSRGVAGAAIFVDDVDRQTFVRILQEVSELFPWRLLAWCLMGTHYHLVVGCPRELLSDALHRLNGSYAQRFNKRHARRGHLFENRFSAWVVRDDEHLHATIGYVLENPVRAGLCIEPRDWLWSGRRLPRRVPLPQRDMPLPAKPQGLSLGRGGYGQESAPIRT